MSNPNTIENAIEYVNNQQEVMRMFNTYLLCADLIKHNIEHTGKTVSYDQISFSDYTMGDFDSDNGLTKKAFTFVRKTRELTQDKGNTLDLDIKHQQEAQIAGGIARVYNFYQIKVAVPFMDKYSFGKLSATGNNAVAFGTLTKSNIASALFSTFAKAKQKRVKTEECLLYITASANALLDEEALGHGVLTVGVWKGNGNWNGDLQTTCTMVKGAKVIEVPDEYLGGASFVLVHPLAFDVIPVLDIVDFYARVPGKPGVSQVDVREYFDAWTQPNGEDGIYIGLQKPRTLDFVKGTNKVTGFTNVEKGAEIYYTTNGSEPTTSSTKWTSGDISVSANATIKAIQVLDGQSSAVASWQNA
jgi:hypothetical protein